MTRPSEPPVTLEDFAPDAVLCYRPAQVDVDIYYRVLFWGTDVVYLKRLCAEPHPALGPPATFPVGRQALLGHLERFRWQRCPFVLLYQV